MTPSPKRQAEVITSNCPAWTAAADLSGGVSPGTAPAISLTGSRDYPIPANRDAQRIARLYGINARNRPGGVSEAEVRWMVQEEFASVPEDSVWRRSTLAVAVQPNEPAALAGGLARLAE